LYSSDAIDAAAAAAAQLAVFVVEVRDLENSFPRLLISEKPLKKLFGKGVVFFCKLLLFGSRRRVVYLDHLFVDLLEGEFSWDHCQFVVDMRRDKLAGIFTQR
jgi:hypothetical protein